MDICSTLNGLLMFIIILALYKTVTEIEYFLLLKFTAQSCNFGLQGIYCIFYQIWVFTPPMIALPQIMQNIYSFIVFRNILHRVTHEVQ